MREIVCVCVREKIDTDSVSYTKRPPTFDSSLGSNNHGILITYQRFPIQHKSTVSIHKRWEMCVCVSV